MRIKQYYTREQLERWPTSRIKRTFMIPRQAKFTKMRLIDKIMKRMDDMYPGNLKEQLEKIKWPELKKLYGVPMEKGLTKQKVIEKILAGEYKLKQ